jgi:ketosteroid isomerase-like protein
MSDHTPDAPSRQQDRLLTRRTTLAALAALAAGASEGVASNGDAVAELIARAEQKNEAFMNGQMERWQHLACVSLDFTLMQPFGGPASHGFDATHERLARLSREFPRGTTALEVAQAYASAEQVVLVMIERQRAEVGGLPEQDWSLRVTEVYRKKGKVWELVHRHADPLVRPITLEQAAALARGTVVSEGRK